MRVQGSGLLLAAATVLHGLPRLTYALVKAGYAPQPGGGPAADGAVIGAPLGPPVPQLGSASFSLDECEVETTGPICLGEPGSQQVLLPPAVPPGVRGLWTFDGGSALDTSGHGGHAFGDVRPGPSLGGQGSSVYLRQSFLEVADRGQLPTKEFTYSFWLYLVGDGRGLPACPLIRKGLDGVEVGASAGAAPALLFDRFTGRLKVELVTSGAPDLDPGLALKEDFQSNARLRPRRWYHVALARHDDERLTRLYVNGLLDTVHRTRGFLRVGLETLYIGGDPLTVKACDLPMYIDELKVYDRIAEVDEIQAEAAPALAGIEPAFVRLGCVGCSLDLATTSCPEEYHVCTSLELHMGGYQVARSLGWMDPGGHVWAHSKAAAETISQAPPSPAAAAVSAPAAALPAAGATALLSGGVSPAPAPAVVQESSPIVGPPQVGLGLCCSDSA